MRNRSKLLTLLSAIGLALLVLVGVVLPAEYSFDPLGSGKALGVVGLADEGVVAVKREAIAHSIDEQEFQLLPFESLEYSYRMEAESSMSYSWQASEELVSNLHSSPDLPPAGAPADYAESFSAGRVSVEYGTYTAPFTGRHGWFWENRTKEVVVLRLAVGGFIAQPRRASVSGQEDAVLAPVF